MFGEVVEGTEALVHYKKHRFKKGPEFAFSMVFVKKFRFFHLFVLMQNGSTKVFGVVLEKKRRLLRLQKHRFKKIPKFAFFPRGLVHGFCQNNYIFPSFVLMQNVWWYLEQKEAFFNYE